MKLFIMTDMEGCAGVLNHDDWVMRSGQFYSQGRRLLTLEVNAAIEGFLVAGAQEFHVVDGHGQGGIDPELLHPAAVLQRGAGDGPSIWGMDDTFDGLAFVGQHAKAGTPYSHITHTQWFNYIDETVNGISIGEYGEMALFACAVGVPTIFATGEQALCDEAEALTPGVVTAATKRGLKADGLDHLDTDQYRAAKLSAVHTSPQVVRERIRAGAKKAAEILLYAPQTFTYPKLTPPYVRTARFRKSGDSEPWEGRVEHPDSLIKVLSMPFVQPE